MRCAEDSLAGRLFRRQLFVDSYDNTRRGWWFSMTVADGKPTLTVRGRVVGLSGRARVRFGLCDRTKRVTLVVRFHRRFRGVVGLP
jgi:hypothetical protein